MHVLALVVEVSHAWPAFTFVVVCAERDALLVGFGLGCAIVIVGYDVGREHLIGLSVPCFSREGKPTCCVAVINDNIGDGENVLLLERADHCLQFICRTERRVLVEIIIRVVAHRRAVEAFSALRNPHQVEISAEIIGLLGESCPLRFVERVPEEALEHHAIIVCWPSLCHC